MLKTPKFVPRNWPSVFFQLLTLQSLKAANAALEENVVRLEEVKTRLSADPKSLAEMFTEPVVKPLLGTELKKKFEQGFEQKTGSYSRENPIKFMLLIYGWTTGGNANHFVT